MKTDETDDEDDNIPTSFMHTHNNYQYSTSRDQDTSNRRELPQPRGVGG